MVLVFPITEHQRKETLSMIQELKRRIKYLENRERQQAHRVTMLEKTIKRQQEEIKRLTEHQNQMEMEKELCEEREECRSFLYAFKDLSMFKRIAYKLRRNKKLNQNERQAVMYHARVVKSQGRPLRKRPDFDGFHDAQNWDGHRIISSDTVDDCLRLLTCSPYVYSYYDIPVGSVNSVENTVKAIESARVDVNYVNHYVQKYLCGSKQKAGTRIRRMRKKFTRPSAKV